MSTCAPKLGQTFTNFVKPKRSVNVTFIHCSATSNPNTDAEEINRWHLDRGFTCIGYHVFVKTDAVAQYGRDMEQTPAAQQGYNSGSIAICCNGLDLSDFGQAQMDKLREVCGQINAAYGNNMTFRPHNAVAAKACPVFDIYKELNLDSSGKMITDGTAPPQDFPPPDDAPEPEEKFYISCVRIMVSKDINATHANVRIVQSLLHGKGYPVGTIDGVAGTKFDNAVAAYQTDLGLVVDGIVGEDTWSALER